MRLTHYFTLLFSLLFSATSFAIPTIQQWEMDNGARVYFVPAPELPMVDVQIVFDAGSARDVDKHGLAALTNGLLNEGAGGLSADQIAEKFDSLGAQFGNHAGRDMAMVSVRSLNDPSLLQPSLELLATVLNKPDFAEVPFERLRQQMLATLKYQEQSPDELASVAFHKALYGTHPYAIGQEGTKDNVSSLTPADVKAFHKRYYVAKNALVAIVGAVDRPSAEKIAQTVLGQLPSGETVPILSTPEELKETNIIHIEHPSTQTHVLIGQLGIARNDPDFFAIYVGNHILGGSGLVSRLSEQVREQRGLAYHVYSYFAPLHVTGPFVAGLQTRNDQAQEALQVLKNAIADFIEKGPSATELQNAQKNLTGGFPLRIDSNADIVSYLATIGFYHMPLDYLHNFTKNIEAVTADKIKEVYKRRLHMDKLVVVTVGKETQAKPKP